MMDGMIQSGDDPAPSSRPVRSPGVRTRYGLAGAVVGALLGLIIGLILLSLLAALRTIGTITGTELEVFAALGAVLGVARGCAVSTRISHGYLLITNPLRSYRLRPDQVAKIVSVPGPGWRSPAALGVLRTGSSGQLPIRALRLPHPARIPGPESARVRALADLARWAQRYGIPLRTSAASWNALLQAQAAAPIR